MAFRSSVTLRVIQWRSSQCVLLHLCAPTGALCDGGGILRTWLSARSCIRRIGICQTAFCDPGIQSSSRKGASRNQPLPSRLVVLPLMPETLGSKHLVFAIHGNIGSCVHRERSNQIPCFLKPPLIEADSAA